MDIRNIRIDRYHLIGALAGIMFFGLMIISNPGKEAHENKLEYVLYSDIADCLTWNLQKSARSLYPGIAKGIELCNMSVDNYLLFGLGKMTIDGKRKTTSIGCLGHVFVILNEKDKRDIPIF